MNPARQEGGTLCGPGSAERPVEPPRDRRGPAPRVHVRISCCERCEGAGVGTDGGEPCSECGGHGYIVVDDA